MPTNSRPTPDQLPTNSRPTPDRARHRGALGGLAVLADSRKLFEDAVELLGQQRVVVDGQGLLAAQEAGGLIRLLRMVTRDLRHELAVRVLGYGSDCDPAAPRSRLDGEDVNFWPAN
jgi:hypothetical protein